mmetsp:Transcript_15631/g.51150  ORF Transcript_15631/g.51150 Transcript_15631/m.51150 type:complete len:204 (-) Transcript_15631:216-827(-)
MPPRSTHRSASLRFGSKKLPGRAAGASRAASSPLSTFVSLSSSRVVVASLRQAGRQTGRQAGREAGRREGLSLCYNLDRTQKRDSRASRKSLQIGRFWGFCSDVALLFVCVFVCFGSLSDGVGEGGLLLEDLGVAEGGAELMFELLDPKVRRDDEDERDDVGDDGDGRGLGEEGDEDDGLDDHQRDEDHPRLLLCTCTGERRS